MTLPATVPDNGLTARRASLLERLLDAWYEDEARAVWILLGSFVVAWASFHTIANATIALHSDNLEMYTWAQHPRLGYPPHPPLGAWIVAAWFAIFPATDWSFHLLAMVNSAIALYAIDLIARRYVSGDKRLVVLLLLLLLPFYQFRGQRFSVNLTLLSLWPIATGCFLRAFETRTVAWSVAAGVTAALAMLGKYYSIYLIAAFVLAALAHVDRWTYLKSSSPWISMLVGVLALAPHMYWLATTGFQPFQYALDAHAGASLHVALVKAATYAIDALAYAVLPIAVFILVTRPRLATIAASLWPSPPRLRMLAVLFWAPLVLPPLSAPLFGAVLTPLWTMQGWFLLPVLLLAPDEVSLSRAGAVKIALGVLAVTAAVLLAAPFIAFARYVPGTSIVALTDKEARVHAKAMAGRVTELWHEATGRRLTIVAAGSDPPPYAVTFYSADHPDSIVGYDLRFSPWITRERLRREGWLAVCPLQDTSCIARASEFAAGGPQPRRIEFATPATSFLGWHRNGERYVALLSIPKDKAAP